MGMLSYSKSKALLITLVWISLFLCISYVIGLVTRANMDWYATLQKSSLTPPDIAFPIVWSILYILLAISGAILCLKPSTTKRRNALIIFTIYMLINWAWSFIFFDNQMIELGFYWIITSQIPLAAYIYMSYKTSKISSLLSVPTFIWASFAAYLNYIIMIMN